MSERRAGALPRAGRAGARSRATAPRWGCSWRCGRCWSRPSSSTGSSPTRPGPPPATLDGFEIAARLSYFLWSSMPDDELFARSRAGALRQPEEIIRPGPPHAGRPRRRSPWSTTWPGSGCTPGSSRSSPPTRSCSRPTRSTAACARRCDGETHLFLREVLFGDRQRARPAARRTSPSPTGGWPSTTACPGRPAGRRARAGRRSTQRPPGRACSPRPAG